MINLKNAKSKYKLKIIYWSSFWILTKKIIIIIKKTENWLII